jgi:hypothetical protein
MAEDDSLIPEVPTDILNARIGACYNQVTRKLIPAVFAITPSLVSGDNVMFINGRGTLSCIANSTSHEAASKSIFQIDTKAEAGYEGGIAGVQGSLDFNMESTQSHTSGSEEVSVICNYSFLGSKQYLMKQDPEDLIKIMSPSFFKAYTAVCQAENLTAYMEAYNNFTKDFGHACVTTVFLTAGSSFKLTLSSCDDAATLSTKYGGSFALNGHYGGGYGGISVATQWAGEQQDANKKAELSVHFENVPSNAPTSDWANNMLTLFSGTLVTDFANKASKIEPASINLPATAPSLSGKPEKRDLPKRNSDKLDISSSLQKQFMNEDGFEGSWDEYIAKQKEALDSLLPEKIVEEAKNSKALTL